MKTSQNRIAEVVKIEKLKNNQNRIAKVAKLKI